MHPLPSRADCVVVGAGFAGAASASALAGAGLRRGVIVEQETTWGFHSSGRNAAIMRLAEHDPVIASLARRSLATIRRFERVAGPLLRPVGGITVAPDSAADALRAIEDSLKAHGTAAELLSRTRAVARFPFLSGVEFDAALWCADDGVVDIHALLGLYVARAREAGFTVRTGCRVEALVVEGGRVTGVHTSCGAVRTDLVVDAGGAWAGRLASESAPLPLQPLRRHLFVSAPTSRLPADAPVVWFEEAALYFRPESGGLLMCPCDEAPAPPGAPATDPAVAELLAEKVAQHAPGFADLEVRRAWAGLRTFAPDRRPAIGPDPRLPGLVHASGLGGFGMMTSAAVGELVADLLTRRAPDWIDWCAVAPTRFAAPMGTS